MRARYQGGSVVFDKRRGTWNFIWRENGQRRSKLIGTRREYPTKSAAQRAAEILRPQLLKPTQTGRGVPTVRLLIDSFRAERMPIRHSTRLGYEAWLKNHILPIWGDRLITDIQARPVELWLQELNLAAKSKAHIRGLLRSLWEFAMWRGDVLAARNPMELVRLSGTNRPAQPRRSLTVEEFQKFRKQLREPFSTIAVLCTCLGLRISECLALRWSDVDWLGGALSVKRGIVRQIVADTKTPESRKEIILGPVLLELLRRWKQITQFGQSADWVFASPVQLGALPWSYPNVWKTFRQTARDAQVGHISPHVLRHTYRAWLADLCAPLEIQHRLMRHTDIRMTMKYGDRETSAAMEETNRKIAGLVLNGSQDGSRKV